MDDVIPAPPVMALPGEATSGGFGCAGCSAWGRNYAAHARERSHDADGEPPFFFTKPADALVPGGGTIPYPRATADLHHEVELVVGLGRGGVDIPEAQASSACSATPSAST
jgi:fumarylpyruvate hydrolase